MTAFSPIRRRLLGALCTLPALPLAATAGPARDGLPLLMGQEAPDSIHPAGFLVSEKYDGVRAVWDGQRLRFRSGIVVATPGWFTAALPAAPLDGELWLGRGRFDELSGSVRRSSPDDAAWRQLRYMVFDMPGTPGPFAERAQRIAAMCRQVQMPQLAAVKQDALADRAALQRRLQEVVAAGGEGLMLHRADATWSPGRSAVLLKLKPLHDAEALVIGHEPGRGRLAGQLGALRVRTAQGHEFSLGSGLSDAQRKQPPALGSWVSYSHRGHTPGGLPRFASFLRVREL